MNDLTLLQNVISEQPMALSTKDGASLYLWQKASHDDFSALSSALRADGYSVLESRTFAGLSYEKSRKDDTTVYLTFSVHEQALRLIAKESDVDVVAQGMQGEAKYAPLLTQLSLAYYIPDCGMSYVFRLSDGRFVIIDGGYDEYETVEHLWDTIEKQNETGKAPVIAAWFLSHGHEDHFTVMSHFLDVYGDRVEIQNVFINWAHRLQGKHSGEVINMAHRLQGKNSGEELLAKLDEQKDRIRTIVPRSGDRYEFGGMVFDVMFVGEDLYPAEIPSFNDSSLILRISAAGKVMLFPADSEHQSSDFICARFDHDVFKCDLLQVAHHGYYGGSETLYALAAPEVLFWPCPDYWYPVVKEWGANPNLRAQENVKAIFVGGRMEKTFDLTKPFDHDDDPYEAFAAGETIYEETFPEGRRVAELGWSALTGGYTGYGASRATMEPGCCTLETRPNRYDVACFVQEGLLVKNPDYTLTMTGKVEKYEKVGLFYDYTYPTKFNEDYALWLDLPTDADFTVTLRTDSKAKKAFFSVCGGEETEIPYREVGGLYLILREAKVILTGIRVVRN